MLGYVRPVAHRHGSFRRPNRCRYLALYSATLIAVVTLKSLFYPVLLPTTKYEWASTIGNAVVSASVSHTSQNSNVFGPPHYRAYPFHFSCPTDGELPALARHYSVVVVYRVKMVNNWRDIFHDQITTIAYCGLGRVASRIVISYRNGRASELQAALKEYQIQLKSIQIDLVHDHEPGENSFDASATGLFCSAAAGRQKDQKHIVHVVFHLRNSGVSEYQPDWYIHKKRNDEGPYSRSLYWRKYSEYFVLERPWRCLKAIVNDGALSCGVNLRSNNASSPLGWQEDIWAAACPIVAPEKKDRKMNIELHRTKKKRSERLIHPEEYLDDKNSTPRFLLNCSYFEVKDEQEYQIMLAYHIGFLNNWREIVLDQLSTLSFCGLGAAATLFLISHSNATASDLKELTSMIEDFDINAVPRFIEANNIPYEGPIMNGMRDVCSSIRIKTIVFYFHNKGVSRYSPDWSTKGDIDRLGSEWRSSNYAFMLYWRKYMEFFTLERPRLCIDAIIYRGVWACGVNMRPSHYSGNIFVADCGYVKSLPPVAGTGYLTAEAFIGRGMKKTRFMQGRFVNLHDEPPAGKAGYRHLMLPEEYMYSTTSSS